METSKMKFELKEISPAIAQEWLARSEGKNYRTIDKNRVKRYAKAMTDGLWELNGQTIQLNCDGTVIDGQHRLMAVVQSQVTVEMLIVSGVVSDGLHIDRGKPRTIAQHLQNKGISNAGDLAAISRLCIMHAEGAWTDAARSKIVMDDDIVRFAIENEPKIRDCLNLVKHTLGIPRSLLAAVAFLGTPTGLSSECDVANWFFTGLKTGVMLKNTDPVFHLRAKAVAVNTTRPTPFQWRMLVTKAWNYTVMGKEMRTLRIRLTGPASEELPTSVLVCEDDTNV